MPFDSAIQRAEAKINVGKTQVRMASAKRASALPQPLSNADVLELASEGTKKILSGTQELNRLKNAQSTDDSQ